MRANFETFSANFVFFTEFRHKNTAFYNIIRLRTINILKRKLNTISYDLILLLSRYLTLPENSVNLILVCQV